MSNFNQYTVGWICAVDTEFIAAEMMFDRILEEPDDISPKDPNGYKFGQIEGHNVVVSLLPHCQHGISSATATVKDMLRSFPIRHVLMVGIAGGAPNLDDDIDIRLGDVVVSSPGYSNGGVLHYGYGRKVQDEADPLRFETTGFLNQPPMSMLNAMNLLKATHQMKGHLIQEIIQEALGKWPELKQELRRKLERPSIKTDKLYKSHVIHVNGQTTCDNCGYQKSTLVSRPPRDLDDDDPAIHYGLVASSDSLMEDAKMRDRLSKEKGVLCFETEAAGIMNHVPCIVIRGVWYYSDSHKNDIWQGYAAMTAAAYAKELLGQLRPDRVEAQIRLIDRIDEAFSSVNKGVQSIKMDLHQDNTTHWLLPSGPSINHNTVQEQHHHETNQWLLRNGP
ncbi:nucleoside phosphorylase domain-containing protein [Hypoxylon fragiforme]|uniref:nucleoside phosphorylase domain-containing protein n=1 Tax=Hypoxylon fragiforme TaxID=63214 RepID=UPI0020C6309C|nr:nucleoside phosphorylase domain-containing protein [Hypoxylon fragiforme]KAI2613084.1 nucleoside phosphorylase domain-containing protein [Hypoxylon fragiforme]